ncbi:MAG: PorT family protein, partial [Prevotella sp.]|nr:PorT family protein [Prevotella sp.]
MKKFLVAIMAVLFSAPSFAQYSSGGFNLSESSLYYGIRLGMNFANLTGDAPDLGTKVGLNFGGTVGLRLSDTAPVFLESGLYYTGYGASKDKNSISLNYLELPILIKYGVQLNDDIALLPFIGPTFRYGLFGGKWKTSGAGKVDSFGDHKFKRADMGIKLGCGAEYNKLYAELGYQFGITNIADWPLANGDDASAHNGALFFNV